MVDTLERPIHQRQLLLLLEDSTRIDLGSMNAFRLSESGAKKVEQNLTARVPAMHFRSMTRAMSVKIELGDTRFTLTRQQMDGLRALYAATVCGGQPNS